jgi:hypothetical protein
VNADDELEVTGVKPESWFDGLVAGDVIVGVIQDDGFERNAQAAQEPFMRFFGIADIESISADR